MFNVISSENRAAYEIMWRHRAAEQDIGDSIIRCMRFPCLITKATNTDSEHAAIIAVPWQQWLCERASVLRYTYIAMLPVMYRTFRPKTIHSTRNLIIFKKVENVHVEHSLRACRTFPACLLI
jgi:hypothetical protein